MTSATDPATVDPIENTRVSARPVAETRNAGIAQCGDGRPPTIGPYDPRTELDAAADRVGAK